MIKEIKKHKEKYIHIPKKALWLIIGLPLVLHNVHLIISAYTPIDKLAILQAPLWFFNVIILGYLVFRD